MLHSGLGVLPIALGLSLPEASLISSPNIPQVDTISRVGQATVQELAIVY